MGNQSLEEVASGVLRGVSFAYNILGHRVDDLGAGRQRVTADKWAAYEITLTPIPADPTVGVGRADAARLAPLHALRFHHPIHPRTRP
jgi:phage head maturation protease